MRKWGFVAVAIAIAGCAGLAAPALADDDEPGAGAHGADRDKAVETENIFGFTAGSDTGDASGKGVSAEATPRIGKRIGAYRALGTKNDSASASPTTSTCRSRRSATATASATCPSSTTCAGAAPSTASAGGPLALPRPQQGTVRPDPPARAGFARIDGGSGLAGRAVGAENKLIFDRELVPASSSAP